MDSAGLLPESLYLLLHGSYLNPDISKLPAAGLSGLSLRSEEAFGFLGQLVDFGSFTLQLI